MDSVCKLFIIVLSCFRVSANVTNDRFYPRYHLAPVGGWMNDPNGFCLFKGEYHLFYQYNPESSEEPGTARWGHAKSKDLFNWVDLGIAMEPDKSYDQNGVFSGSAVVESDTMYLFYTGHVNHPGQTPDHTEVQALATSTDGVAVTKYQQNPIIKGDSFQPDIRDPKVWKHRNAWYMVLGNSFTDSNNQRHGRVLLFTSSDRINWKQLSVLDESDGSLGYMWECPDFFEIDGYHVLLFSPQGITAQGDKYKNLYQTGYIVGIFDYDFNVFTRVTDFIELDHGHDFYATQTILDSRNRRLLVAWLDMWETQYEERNDGFTGQMTLIRELSLTKDHRLIQKPVKEVDNARGKPLFVGNSHGGTKVPLSDKAGVVTVVAPRTEDFTLYIESGSESVAIKYEFINGRVSLDRGGTDGVRRTRYRPLGKLKLKVFVDASSIEVFFGEGEVTFSSRFFIDGPLHVRLADNCVASLLTVHEMKRTLYLNKNH